jgi:DNA polymerase IV
MAAPRDNLRFQLGLESGDPLMSALCRDCLADVPPHAAKCPACAGNRVLSHPELDVLSIAHVDCDAFYAAVEKRDNPALEGKPLIVGFGGQRGVVATACYVARRFGVKSAMPMFQARKLCPQAVIIPPDMGKYSAVAHEMRALLLALTPLVETLSLDEAYLDLSGTARLHAMSPAKTLAVLLQRIEKDIGITVSVGLSCNKFLAKLASDLDKPRGFAVIGAADVKSFLRDMSIAVIRGVGPVLQERLGKDGFSRIAQLQDADPRSLTQRYGDTGLWLHRLANGEDARPVEPDGEAKSLSAETTFETNLADPAALEHILWDQSERVSARAKATGVGGRTVTLKLKTPNFRIRTRSVTLDDPTQLSDVIFRVGRALLLREATGGAFRLLGIGLSQIRPAAECDPPDLLDQRAARRAAAERAMDSVRERFGKSAMLKGRSLGEDSR